MNHYTEAPGVSMSVTCHGDDCGFSTVRHNGDVWVCDDCGTWWDDLDSDGHLQDEDAT